MTNPKAPVLDVLVARDGGAWRLYFAPGSWMPGLIGRADPEGTSVPTIHPVGVPNVADLDRYMWGQDAPYQRHETGNGGVEIVARGRSAVILAVWLQELVHKGSARPASP